MPGRAHLVLHLPAASLRAGGEPPSPVYLRVIADFTARGGIVKTVPHIRDMVAEEVAADTHFHLVNHGDGHHPRLLNVGLAYVYPFWHFDPLGFRAASSIGAMPFHASRMDGAATQAFFARLRKRLVGNRVSRYEQPRDRADFPAGCVAVFLQSEAHRGLRETCYLTQDAMLRALLARPDPRPIVIKPHPLEPDGRGRALAIALAAQDARVIVTDANLHDILDHAAVTVTINSAVGLESMLHRVPVVLCGQADFHHCAVTVRSPGALDAGIAAAEARAWPFARYLYWYFGLNCVNAGAPDLLDSVLARIAATGFDTGRFALAPAAG
ncbi:MAG: hypothetical protein GC186_14030 [Rhodobacteraceae bacterium]|nr:hypothetical protein [Paracoccaceae bacterium]